LLQASASEAAPVSARKLSEIIRSTAAWLMPLVSCHQYPVVPSHGVALVSRIQVTRPGKMPLAAPIGELGKSPEGLP
jgi:hypothetical protein